MTLNPGKLIVASAYPDPPFDLIDHGSPGGFDIELMRAISAQLSLTLQPVRYAGDDFNGIFDGLAKRSYDAVISWLVKDRPRLSVPLQVPTHEKLGIAFAKDNEALCSDVNRALVTLRGNGDFARLQARWFP